MKEAHTGKDTTQRNHCKLFEGFRVRCLCILFTFPLSPNSLSSAQLSHSVMRQSIKDLTLMLHAPRRSGVVLFIPVSAAESSQRRARGGDQLNFRIVGTWKIRGRLFILLQSALLPSCASSAKTANLGGQCSTWKTPEAKRLVPVPPTPTSTVADWDAAACFKGNVSGQMTHLAP